MKPAGRTAGQGRGRARLSPVPLPAAGTSLCLYFIFIHTVALPTFSRIPLLEPVGKPGKGSHAPEFHHLSGAGLACWTKVKTFVVGIRKETFAKKWRSTCVPWNQKLSRVAGRSTVAPRTHWRTDSAGQGAERSLLVRLCAAPGGLGSGQPGRLAAARQRHAVLFKSSTFFAVSPLAGWGYPPCRGRG